MQPMSPEVFAQLGLPPAAVGLALALRASWVCGKQKTSGARVVIDIFIHKVMNIDICFVHQSSCSWDILVF